ncbi:hypothetical protein INT08_02055 [Prosthecochloris sp. N3]|uniref:Uncharacterized protein n=1 Tax=Prosthecochloris ethylica TaxID=2743976 RepID=A0ABR9XPU8_9CHLB|nr:MULTISPECIES: hypothetical protein [Prosthecochloris]MBF0586263.1 hypothetical protein [Prosthecochloris ethylica]MBF0635969.1 hypothetical protein [Prosthecochloris ethylica]NUK47356.1 hypothetical protein [Prosthecochloris ethylica]RNA64911.1 hypothetical protein CR163_006525 [Prosthecochloris sp. ZM_2]
MGDVYSDQILNLYFKDKVRRFIGEAVREHAVRLTPESRLKSLQRSPVHPVGFDVRLKIKEAWPRILDHLDEGETDAAVRLAVDAGFTEKDFRALLRDKVRLALVTIHASMRLAGVPDLKLLQQVARRGSRLDERSTGPYLKGILYPAMARRMSNTLFWSRSNRNERDTDRTTDAFVDMMTSLEKSDDSGAKKALQKHGYSPTAAEEIVDNPARFCEFVLDAVLADKPDVSAIEQAAKDLAKPYQVVEELNIGSGLKKELTEEDLKVLNVTLDACRAG